ncbi:hypothetical protein GCM10027298_04580 [Epidermidibacterium keratini]
MMNCGGACPGASAVIGKFGTPGAGGGVVGVGVVLGAALELDAALVEVALGPSPLWLPSDVEQPAVRTVISSAARAATDRVEWRMRRPPAVRTSYGQDETAMVRGVGAVGRRVATWLRRPSFWLVPGYDLQIWSAAARRGAEARTGPGAGRYSGAARGAGPPP